MKNVESYKITVLDTTYTDLRGKYQERYDLLPVNRVEGSSQTSLQLRVTLILMRYISQMG